MRSWALAFTLAIIVVASAAVALFSQLTIYISVITIGLALALQKHLGSYFAYFVITYSHVFNVGDRIRIGTIIGTIKGDVRKIGLFHFVLEEVGEDEKLGGELTGRVVHIPNLVILDQAVLNYSKDYTVQGKMIHSEYIFDEIRIPLTSQSFPEKAVRILEDVLRAENRAQLEQARVMFGDAYPNYVTEAEHGPHVIISAEPQRIWLKGKFVTSFRTRNELRTKILLEFIERIRQEADIKLA